MHTQIQLTYLSFAWFQSWRPFWSYPLLVKSLTVADPFFSFRVVWWLMFSSSNRGLCQKWREVRKKKWEWDRKGARTLFFFRTLVFFLHAREKKYRSRRRLRTHVSTSLDGRSSTTSSSLASSRPPVDVGFGGDGVHGVAFFGRYFLLFLSLGLSFFFLSFSLSLRVFSFSFNNKTIDWSRKPLFLSLLFQKGRTRTRTESHTWRACR